MALGEYLVGLAVLAATWGCALGVAWLIVERRLPRLGGAPRVLAFALVALAALIAVHMLPALVGVLSRWSALLPAAALLAVAYRFVPRLPGAAHDDTPPAAWESGPVSWAIAALAAAIVAVWNVAKLWVATGGPSEDIDSITFHLPNVARWMQSGSFWQIDQFNALLANGNYPNNGDVVFLSVVQPLRSDAFVGLVSAPFVALAGLAVYGIARELRAPRATSALAGVVFAALPVVSIAAHDGAKTDAILLTCFASGVLFMLRHLRLGRTADLVLGGLGFGLAFGTKWYGVSGTIVAVSVWLAALALQRRDLRVVVRSGAVLGGLVAAAGGFWLVRNAVKSGSPVFPVGLGPWETPTDFIRDCAGFRIVDYLTDTGIWSDYILPAYRANFGVGGALLVGGWLLAVALAVADRLRRRDDARAAGSAAWVLIALTAGLAAAYAVTPYTAFGPEGRPILVGANTRWLMLALLGAAPLFAWAAARLGGARIVAELAGLAAVVDGVRRGFELEARTLVAATAGLLLVAAAVYAVFALRARLPRRRLAVPVAAAALAVLALVALGYARQDGFYDKRYRMPDDAVLSWFAERAQSGHRVALAGSWSVDGLSPVWPAFGPRIGNRVEYLGTFVDGQLREYDDEAAWRRALAGGGYDLLVVGRGGYGGACPIPGEESNDDAYARAAGLRPLARTGRLTLYEVPRGMIGAR
jgi:hypothetical protein